MPMIRTPGRRRASVAPPTRISASHASVFRIRRISCKPSSRLPAQRRCAGFCSAETRFIGGNSCYASATKAEANKLAWEDKMTVSAIDRTPWWNSLSRAQWNTLLASNLGWLFDGYETYAVIITIGVALRQLLEPAQFAQIPFYAGFVIALTLLGWGVGGLIAGVLTDYLGRKRTMILAIAAYSVMTGLSAFAWNWESFAALRFLVGVAIGSEWVTGASIVAELWPDRARGKGVGLMQCGLGIGFFVASFVWLFIGPLGPSAWRYMFLLGVLPALLTLWVRRTIPESTLWESVNERRQAALARKRSGEALADQDQALARFTVADLFVDPEVRRRVILAFLMSLATTFAFWGISPWLPPYISAIAARA